MDHRRVDEDAARSVVHVAAAVDDNPPHQTGPLLRDPERQAAFERDGYVVVPLLEPDEVSQLAALYYDLTPERGPAFLSTADTEDYEYRVAVDAGIRRISERAVKATFADARMCLGVFLVKEPSDSDDGTVPVHQDWTMVDEDRFYSAGVWCPLVDTDETNGVIHFVAGTHRLGPTWRGPHLPSCYPGLDEEIIARHLTPVPCRPGEGIVHDGRLVHWSPPNRSSGIRLVAGLRVISTGAEPLHFDIEDDGTIIRHHVDDDFLLRVRQMGETIPPTLRAERTRLKLPRFEAYQLPRPVRDASEPVDDRATVTPVPEEVEEGANEPDVIPAVASARSPLAPDASGAPPPGPNPLYAALPAPVRRAARAGWDALPAEMRSTLRPSLRKIRRLVTTGARTSEASRP